MKRELYRRWLDDERGLTLSEFVAERRAELRHARAQRRMNAIYGPMLQRAAQEQMARAQAGMQGMPHPMQQMQGIAPGLLGGIFGWGGTER